LKKLVLLLGVISSPVFAQDEFEEIKILDNPRYSLTDKFTLDVDLTFLPLDGYYKPIIAEAALNYQLNDLLAVEIARIGYSFYNHDTGLKKSIERKIQNETGNSSYALEDQALADMRYHVGTAAYVNLLYSKSNFFNSAIVYHQWQLGSGISYYDMDKTSQMTLDLSMRVRFFLSEKVTLNIRGGHSIGFKSDAPRNLTFLGMGVGLAF